LARLSGVPLTNIRNRRFEPDDPAKLVKGFERIGKVLDRLAFAKKPNDLDSIACAADDFNADLIIADYLQRIKLPGRYSSMRDQINALMDKLRPMAQAGVGIIAAAALTRGGKGKSAYNGKRLGLASFRESSELEYGADDCFLLYPTDSDADPADPVRLMTLNHAKSRDGETKNVELKFHRRFQRFESCPFKTTVTGSSSSVGAQGNGRW
jgi:replicative DNA helicase